MTPETAAKLREPFPAEHVGKLPRVYCKACRDSQYKVCQQHERRKCRDCGSNITTAHLHLDYVGHAEITDRLLQVDPAWTWEPVALGAEGLPLLDRNGGLWIRLTVAGVTRLGYGHADGKTGPDAVKEAIGDALRNSAMRFGVALDLWGAKFKEDAEPEQSAERDEWEQAEKPPSVEQATVFDLLTRKLAEAASPDEITALGGRVRRAQDDGLLTVGQYRALSNRAAQRIAELAQMEAADEERPS